MTNEKNNIEIISSDNDFEEERKTEEVKPKKRFDLGEYSRNATPEERSLWTRKGVLTKRKNKLEEKIMARAMTKALNATYKTAKHDNSGKRVYLTGADAISQRLVNDLLDPENVKYRAGLYKVVKETVDGIPEQKREVQHTGTVTWEHLVNVYREDKVKNNLIKNKKKNNNLIEVANLNDSGYEGDNE